MPDIRRATVAFAATMAIALAAYAVAWWSPATAARLGTAGVIGLAIASLAVMTNTDASLRRGWHPVCRSEEIAPGTSLVLLGILLWAVADGSTTAWVAFALAAVCLAIGAVV